MFALGAIVSLCYVPGVTGALIATQWPVLSILLPLGLWRSGPMTLFHWVGLLFVAYAFAHLYSVPVFEDGIWGLWLLCIAALSFWLGSTLDNLRSLYTGLAIGASVSSVIAVLQHFGVAVVPYVSTNPAGLYVNSVVLGMVLSMLVVALISERMWLWVPALLPGLWLSGSRGGWLALVIGLLSVYVRRLWIFGGLALVGAILVLTAEPKSSDELRLLIWYDALHFLTPLGWGPGSFFSWLIPYRDTLIHPEYAHNDALQFVFEYGIAAALPLGLFAFALTRTGAQEWPVFVTFAVLGCYSMPLWAPITAFLGCVVAGRVVRDWALARMRSDGSRLSGVSRQRSGSGEAVSVGSDYQTARGVRWQSRHAMIDP